MDNTRLLNIYLKRMVLILLGILVVSLILGIYLVNNKAMSSLEMFLEMLATKETSGLDRRFGNKSAEEINEEDMEYLKTYAKFGLSDTYTGILAYESIYLLKDQKVSSLAVGDKEDIDIIQNHLVKNNFSNFVYDSLFTYKKYNDEKRIGLLKSVQLKNARIIVLLNVTNKSYISDMLFPSMYSIILTTIISVGSCFAMFWFYSKMFYKKLSTDQRQMSVILQKINESIYVIHSETKEVLYKNAMAAYVFGDSVKDITVYFEQECKRRIEKDESGIVCIPQQIYVQTIDKWFDFREELIEWVHGETVRIQYALDITETKKAQLDSESLSAKISGYFSIISDPLFEMDTKAYVQEIHASKINFAGYGKEQLMGKCMFDLIHPDDLERVVGKIREASYAHSFISDLEVRYIGTEGSIYYYSVDMLPIFNEYDYFCSLHVVHKDITIRKAIEKQLDVISGIVRSATNIAFAIDSESRIMYQNDAFTDLFGFLEGLGPENYLDMFDLEHDVASYIFNNTIIPAVLDYGSFICEIPVITVEGKRSMFLFNFFKLVSRAEGEFMGIGSFGMDVTEQNMLREQGLRSEAILNSFKASVVAYDLELNLVYKNVGCYEITGYSEDECEEFDILDKVLESHGEIITPDFVDELRDMEQFERECFVIHKEKDTIPVSHMVFPVKNINGVVFSIASIMMDISHEKEREKQLIEAKDIAEQASKAKGEFLSKMSHEIRTPMNAIIGMTNIALKSSDKVKTRESLEKIDIASKHLLNLINDILNFSKMESGKLTLINERFDLEKTFELLLEVISVQANQKRLKILIDMEPNIPTQLMGDTTRFTQILVNLFSNAIKFTPDEGSVTMTVKKGEHLEERIELLFEVIDTGIGVSKENADKIFDAFQQVDSSLSRKHQGTGLGLPITKSIIELMDGNIELISEDGKGSTFKFNIWFGLPATNFSERTIQSEKNLNILLVDDNVDERKYLNTVLDSLGIQNTIAGSGEEALDIVKNSNADNPYNLVILDYYMPGMNGMETARALKKELGENLPLILMSAFDYDSVEDEAKTVGISKFIPKPVLPSALIDGINQTLMASGYGQGSDSVDMSEPEEQEMQIPNLDGLKILIFEDIDINREIVEFVLEPTNAQIEFAYDANMGIDIFSKAPESFDLILMDIQMPGMDGYQATRTIRSSELPNSKTIPIIAMTANAFKEDVDMALESGMNAHVGKPIEEEQLFNTLTKYTVGIVRK